MVDSNPDIEILYDDDNMDEEVVTGFIHYNFTKDFSKYHDKTKNYYMRPSIEKSITEFLENTINKKYTIENDDCSGIRDQYFRAEDDEDDEYLVIQMCYSFIGSDKQTLCVSVHNTQDINVANKYFDFIKNP